MNNNIRQKNVSSQNADVFIDKSAIEKINAMIHRDPMHECGGIFIGNVSMDEVTGKYTVHVHDLYFEDRIGTGIFTIIGSAIVGNSEGAGAGSAIIISMLLAALASVFSALSYSEIAAMIPVAGSAYTYTYATMGEFMAWMVGWILMRPDLFRL